MQSDSRLAPYPPVFISYSQSPVPGTSKKETRLALIPKLEKVIILLVSLSRGLETLPCHPFVAQVLSGSNPNFPKQTKPPFAGEFTLSNANIHACCDLRKS